MIKKIFGIIFVFVLFNQAVYAGEYNSYYNRPTQNQQTQNNFAEYMENVKQKLQQNWLTPDILEEGHVRVLFKIDRQGNVISGDILESSGNKLFDESAVNAIHKSEPFGDFPQNTTRSSLTINYSFDTSFVKTDKMKEYYELAKKYSLTDRKEALKYINLAIKSNKKEGEKLNYLRGHIYLAQENKTESLKYFDLAYNTYPQSATQTDLQAYMYLLADSDQIENCIKILDFYLQTGKWFLGLGTFASTAYEKLDMLQESILFAFLEYEYVSSFQDVDNTKFIENLNNTENLLKQNNKYEIASPALTLIKSLFDSDSVPKGKIVDNFISNYCLVKYNLQNNILTEQDFSVLLSLEKYFKSFPSYYWTVWNVVKNLDESQLKNYLVILKKIIALNPSGVFAQKARVEIETLFDLKIEDINSLDSLIF